MFRFCAMIAFALPSRSLETTNSPMRTVSPAFKAWAALVRLISRIAVWPAETFTVSVAVL
mgnify:CR=1 FL=1